MYVGFALMLVELQLDTLKITFETELLGCIIISFSSKSIT